MLRAFFDHAAGLRKAAKAAFAAAAGVAVLAAGLSGVQPRDLWSDGLEEKLRENGLDPALAGRVSHRDIRFYHPYNPLAYIVAPFHRTQSDMSRSDTSDPGWSAAGRYQEHFLHMTDALLSTGTGGFIWAETYPPAGDNDTCYIVGPGDIPGRAAMTRSFTELPAAWLRDFSGGSAALKNFILLHEATHCGAENTSPRTPESVLAEEIEADLASVALLKDQGATAEDRLYLRHLRAVSPFSRPGILDVTHATAMALDAQALGAPAPPARDILLANIQLYYAVAGKHRGQRVSRDEYGLFMYRAMKEMVAQGELDGKPLTRRAAELYIQGFEYLAPKAPGVAPAQAPAPRPSA